jgi:hypothetical protein
MIGNLMLCRSFCLDVLIDFNIWMRPGCEITYDSKKSFSPCCLFILAPHIYPLHFLQYRLPTQDYTVSIKPSRIFHSFFIRNADSEKSWLWTKAVMNGLPCPSIDDVLRNKCLHFRACSDEIATESLQSTQAFWGAFKIPEHTLRAIQKGAKTTSRLFPLRPAAIKGKHSLGYPVNN